MGKAYIHLSDIHFGQEKGGHVYINNDVKERLIDDISTFVVNLTDGRASGVIVTGDIAYSGKHDEYTAAGAWLDRVAAAAKCNKTDIQVVPGNHDIDRDVISLALEGMLQEIVNKGESALDEIEKRDLDREFFYARFRAYRPFAEAYDSPLDTGGVCASNRTISLAPGRTLQFIGFNTALICSKQDAEGQLLLGARQRILPRSDGHELVVIAHHQLPWLQDSEEASRYLRTRARVFISGHEHVPSVEVDSISAGQDLLKIAAGATIPPPTKDEPYKYTYNILEFNWEPGADALCVTIYPRMWSEETKEFVEDTALLKGKGPKFVLGSPQFRKGQAVVQVQTQASGSVATKAAVATQMELNEMEEFSDELGEKGADNSKLYPRLLLSFFRDHSPAQRISILVKLGALPEDWTEALTHTMERHVFDSLSKTGRLPELEAAIKMLDK